MSEKWGDFEHRLWETLKAYGLDQAPSFLVAVSGGLDSMVLYESLKRVRPHSQIRVAHFHHGDCENAVQRKYRDEVADFVKHKISSELIFEKSDIELKSEDEMREARWNFLRRNARAEEPILVAHHLDDALETLLLKMMRGTSLEGAAGFQMWNGEIFRPLLQRSKSELVQYAKQHSVPYLDDPSNQDPTYLRNWVREVWLKQLEARQSGAVANLSRSLMCIIEEATQTSTFELKFFRDEENDGLDRSWFMSLSDADQLKALAQYLKKQQIFQFTRGQLEEIRKRLDKNQKELTFELFHRKWVINASQIMLR